MKNFRVTKADEGVRLDKFLVRRLRGTSRHQVKELIDSGKVKVNSKRVVIAKWEVAEGDEVEVRIDSDFRATHPAEKERRAFIKIVFEDRDIIVVEKPAGAIIQHGERGGVPTYVDSLREYLKRRHKSRGAYVKPVHRLDRETTGLMVFAKSRVGEVLMERFKRHEVERSYLAVVEGQLPDEKGQVDLPVIKGNFGFGRRAGIGRRGEGLSALTFYTVIERYEAATLVRLDLKTGRTHQARVHMAAIGHPIVGDKIYGKADGIEFGRVALHSHILAIRHPKDGRRMEFRSDLPLDMSGLVEKLREGK